MPTNTQIQQHAAEVLVEEAFADAVVALKRYSRVSHAAYQAIEDTDTAAAREAHGRMLYAEIGLAAVRASAGDEGGRASLRALVAGS